MNAEILTTAATPFCTSFFFLVLSFVCIFVETCCNKNAATILRGQMRKIWIILCFLIFHDNCWQIMVYQRFLCHITWVCSEILSLATRGHSSEVLLHMRGVLFQNQKARLNCDWEKMRTSELGHSNFSTVANTYIILGIFINTPLRMCIYIYIHSSYVYITIYIYNYIYIYIDVSLHLSLSLFSLSLSLRNYINDHICKYTYTYVC